MNNPESSQQMRFAKDMESCYAAILAHPVYQAIRAKKKKTILFLSLGYTDRRSDVVCVQHTRFERAWELGKKQVMQIVESRSQLPRSIKVDIVDQHRTCTIIDFIEVMTRTRKNYVREGISFFPDFSCAFLEQEINGNAFIQIDKQTHRGYLHEPNIHAYMKKHRPHTKSLDFQRVRELQLFTTVGFYYEAGQLEVLKQGGADNGRRDTPLDRQEVAKMLHAGASFLSRNVQEDGRFHYGYFACFDVEVDFYNMLRHASTLYAMCEVYELLPQPHHLEAIERSLRYLVEQGVVYDPRQADTAFIVDGVKEGEQELKLGANAAAILALTKYSDITDDSQYLPLARQLANGILSLQDRAGSFSHVLSYPSFEMKDRFRIVYYDGEAAFALMRLYQQDEDEKWLDAVERAFGHFIAQDYWKYHDHWLSYCTNELTRIRPKRTYFAFGLKNVRDKLDYIYQRETTYPTFLELTLAARAMIERLRESEHADLLEELDLSVEKLEATIHRRAEYQRNGYFYPELAMYYKNPERIAGSFFIRHHSFRARIDDVEHNLSGYCAYYNQYLNEQAQVLDRDQSEPVAYAKLGHQESR